MPKATIAEVLKIETEYPEDGYWYVYENYFKFVCDKCGKVNYEAEWYETESWSIGVGGNDPVDEVRKQFKHGGGQWHQWVWMQSLRFCGECSIDRKSTRLNSSHIT